MQFFDSHTHHNFVIFDADRDAVMSRAREAGVGMNIVGTQLDTSARAVDMAQKYQNTYATVGLHPIHTSKSNHDEQELGVGNTAFTSRGEVFDIDKYFALAQSPNVIAIGECGLDYYRNDANTHSLQRKAFVAQIELANKLQKPLMLHVRPSAGSMDAYADALSILKSNANTRGVAHFFAGDWNVARQFLDIGFMLSFTGVVTFARDYDEVVFNAPADMILSETDAPYVAPVPHRGRRNESAYIPEIVESLAGIRRQDASSLREQILANAKQIFGV